MIQILLHGLKMDPLVSLHYYAPVCALINLLVLPFTEGLAPLRELARVGAPALLANAALAFALNVAAVFLVGAGSGLVLTLAGVFKDILLITGSVLIFGALITPLQVVGAYSLRLPASRRIAHVRCRLFGRAWRPRAVQDGRQQVSARAHCCETRRATRTDGALRGAALPCITPHPARPRSVVPYARYNIDIYTLDRVCA
jgi:hypothetical protein